MAGLSFPWDDDCPDTIMIGDDTYKLIQAATPNNNILWGLYADWDCVYQAANGNVATSCHRRVLWIFDF